MKKSKAPKSLYAGQAPPPRVSIRGASKKISMADLRLEYNGLLAMFAALMESSGGKLLIETDLLKKVTSAGRIIQIVPGTLGYTFQFESVVEPEQEEVAEPVEEKDFLNSDAAAEAREFLRKQREKQDDDSQ